MTTIALSIFIILLAILGLALGVLLGRPPLKGSCGGIACPTGFDCTACPKEKGEQRK